MQRWLNEVLLPRRWATFIVLGLAFFCFGAGSRNLFVLLRANAALIAAHGWQAIMDGGLCRAQGLRALARAADRQHARAHRALAVAG